MRPNEHALVDRFGRQVDYLRFSITDRCDFRCIYCMSENMSFLPRARILTLEEIVVAARAFVQLGVTKIRITGGEPLVRKGALSVMRSIGQLAGLDELVITTNGSQLESMAEALRDAGVKRINISLDTLNAERFRAITRVGELGRVLRGIDAACRVGFKRIKINAVILKNRNHDEVIDLAAFAIERGIDISYIEEMPLGIVEAHDRAEAYYSSDQIRADLEQHYNLLPTIESTAGPSKYLRIAGSDSRIGFISPHSHNFCADCNRVRMTVEGRLLLCLGNEHSVDLKRVMRANPGDDERLKRAIIEAMAIKPEKHQFDLAAKPMIFRHMSVTGG